MLFFDSHAMFSHQFAGNKVAADHLQARVSEYISELFLFRLQTHPNMKIFVFKVK